MACNKQQSVPVAARSNAFASVTDSRPTPRAMRPPMMALAIAAGLITSCGAGCPGMLDSYVIPARDRALPAHPTLENVMRVVNENSARVHSFYASDATLRVSGSPALRATIAVERPRSFRLQANLFHAAAADLGSNDELFWFWFPQQQPEVFFCRHNEYFASRARNLIPVEPAWLIEALGLPSFPGDVPHEGPLAVGQGRLQVTSRIPTPDGTLVKQTLVDESRGWVLAQHLYDSGGDRLATVLATRHTRDAASGAVLPGRVEIEWPRTRTNMAIDLRKVQVNPPPGGIERWQLPSIPGQPLVDLGAGDSLAGELPGPQ